jgi:hypothetical protein
MRQPLPNRQNRRTRNTMPEEIEVTHRDAKDAAASSAVFSGPTQALVREE